MRIIRFPPEEPLPGQDAWVAELEAALAGSGTGPAADGWRELREDVRSLAPAMTPEFEAMLERELQRRGALQRETLRAEASLTVPDAEDAAAAAPPPGGVRAFADHAYGRLLSGGRAIASHRRTALGAGMTAAVAVVAVLLAVVGSGAIRSSVSSRSDATSAVATATRAHGVAGVKSPAVREVAPVETPEEATATRAPSQSAPVEAESAVPPIAKNTPAASAAPTVATPGRVEQLAASVTLATAPANVQTLSDQVGQLTARLGGYVQSSNVQTRSAGASEATLALKLPSTRFAAAMADIGRLAQVRAENQSLEDITDTYNAAKSRLSDAVAARQALLRALAVATTEGQIDSLRERLAEARAAIVRAQNAFNAVSQRAASTEVEVSIVGDAHAASEGLTVHRGLHDAAHVLLVTLTAVLIIAAVLVPLALLLAALAGAKRALIRHRRERALSGP